MTIQEVKNYLNQAYYIDKRIITLQDELSMLQGRLDKCTASYKTTGNGSQPSFEYVLDRVLQYRDRLSREIDTLVTTKANIKTTINRLENPKCKLILTQKYINFHTFEYIAITLGMEQRQVRRLHKKALEDLCNIL